MSSSPAPDSHPPNHPPVSSATTTATAFSPAFLSHRAHLITSVSDSLETVLSQINALNRQLEGIIEIGNEFAAVEGLWSSFEGFMGGEQGQKRGEDGGGGGGSGEERRDDGQADGQGGTGG